MNNDGRHTNSNNHYRRRSSKYTKNRNYNNYKKYDKKEKTKLQQDNEEQYNVTKQQVFNFDEMNFSDELDTSFVEGRKRKKKEQIVHRLDEDYEKEKKKEEKRKKNISFGKLFVGFLLIIFLVALLAICIYLLFKPVVKTKVVTKEKEVVTVDDNYLFLGDSITDFYDLDKYYEDMPVVNSGISGNQTKDILNNMKDRVYQYNPSKVFLLIGTNDIQQKVDEDEIVDNIIEILKEIHENRPYAELYLEAIYPVDEDRDGAQDRTNEEIMDINKELKKYCNSHDVTYIDTFDLLKDPDSDDVKLKEEYSKDGLHLSDSGYKVLTKELMKYLK